MLQFIVLGQIPGTNIQINFSDVLRIALVFLLLLILITEISRFRTHIKNGGKLFTYTSRKPKTIQ